MKVLYYGNCQPGALKLILEQPFKELNVEHIIIECWMDNIEETSFLYTIQTSDMIFTQPIVDNYKDKSYLSTNYILKNAKANAKIFILPSIYFDFYYFDQMYKWKNNEMFGEPSPYHYGKMIDTFHYNQDKTYFMETYYNNKNFKTKPELLKIANESILELRKRENMMKEYLSKHKYVTILTVSEYIEAWYQKALLFYSINHPTNHVFHYLCNKILSKLQIPYKTINLTIDPLYNSDRGILYNCIQEVVDFDISKHKPSIIKYNVNSVEEILDLYFTHYRKPENTKFIV